MGHDAECREELYALGFAVTGKLDEGATAVTVARSVRERVEDLENEARRLRRILSLIAEHEGSACALVEIYRSEARDGEFGVAVCRADRDEEAFCRDVMVAIRELASRLGGQTPEVETMQRRGVTVPRAQGETT